VTAVVSAGGTIEQEGKRLEIKPLKSSIHATGSFAIADTFNLP
jgi:hypothetical protein